MKRLLLGAPAFFAITLAIIYGVIFLLWGYVPSTTQIIIIKGSKSIFELPKIIILPISISRLWDILAIFIFCLTLKITMNNLRDAKIKKIKNKTREELLNLASDLELDLDFYLISGLLIGFLYGLIIGSTCGITFSLILGMISSIIFSLITMIRFNLINGFMLGVSLSFAFGLSSTLFYGLAVGMVTGLLASLTFTLIFGVTSGLVIGLLKFINLIKLAKLTLTNYNKLINN